MKRICLMMTMMAIVTSSASAALVDFSIGGRTDGIVTAQGHLSYDGQGGNLSSTDLTVSTLTYQTGDPVTSPLGQPFPDPWNAYPLPTGKLSFTTGNLLRVEGDSLVFGAGGSISIVGALGMIPGTRAAFTEEIYHGTFTQEVTVQSFDGGFRFVGGAYTGRFNDTFANGYGVSTNLDYNGGITLLFQSHSSLAGGFDDFVSSGDTAIDLASVPEPASMSLFGLGLTGLVFYRRRHRR